MDTEETQDPCTNPMCILHDPNRHWVDDYAYTDPDLSVTGDTPNAETMLTVLGKYFDGRENPPVYRFAVAWVNQETGIIDVVGNPGSDENTTTNLLARAIALLAYQTSVKMSIAGSELGGVADAIKTVINARYGQGAPQMSEPQNPFPYDTGQYL